MMQDRRHIRFQWFAVAAGVVIMAIKFVAFSITGSNAIMSDALESIINVIAGAFALYSLIIAARPKDHDHPYGHGKIEFISAGIEGTLILIAGIAIIWKASFDLLNPHELTQLDFGLYLSAGAGAFNYALGWITERYGRKYRSPTMITSGKHLKSDGYTSLGLILGLVLIIYTRLNWIDGVIAIGFGTFIGIIGIKEVRKSVSGIMDEADFDLMKLLIKEIDSHRNSNWIDLHNFRTQRFGKNIHVDCHLTLPNYFTVEQAHGEIKKMEGFVSEEFPDGVEMFIHADPCVPASCPICSKDACPIRSAAMERKVGWSLENVLDDSKHL